MTRNFRKTLMATTMLAGLAIFAFDTAQAGPNGGPSLGSISGFSSMRMDLNRVGSPGRALSRSDLRVVPTDVVKTTEPKDTKNVGKKDKGTNVARVSNPKSVSGGKGKQNVGNGPNLHINPAIIEAYAVTGGNIGDVSRFDEWAGRLGIGLLVVNVPWGASNGSFDSPVDMPKAEQHRFDPNSLGIDSSGAPGQPDTSKTGQAANVWRTVYAGRRSEDGSYTESYFKNNTGGTRRVREYAGWLGGGTTEETTAPNEEGGTNTHVTARNSTGTVTRTRSEITTARGYVEYSSWDDHTGSRYWSAWLHPKRETTNEKEDAPKEKAEKKDSQPAPEGYGRPSNNGGGWCSPTGGCYRPARNAGPRIIPAETQGSGTTVRRQSPGWATDPAPDGLGGTGGGGGYSGYTPEGERGGDIGGEGNPETGGGDDRPGIPVPGGAGR